MEEYFGAKGKVRLTDTTLNNGQILAAPSTSDTVEGIGCNQCSVMKSSMTDEEYKALDTDLCYNINDNNNEYYSTCDPRLGNDQNEFINTFKRTCHSTFNKNHRIEYRKWFYMTHRL